MTKKLRLTPAMRTAIENAARHGDPAFGMTGRSAYGGFARTLSALKHHGLIDWQNRATPAGRLAIGWPADLGGLAPGEKTS